MCGKLHEHMFWKVLASPSTRFRHTGSLALAEHFDQRNLRQQGRAAAQAARHPALRALHRWEDLHRRDGEGSPRAEPLVTFSHFLPRIELCPEKRFLMYGELMKVVGSNPLGRRVAQLQPDVHLFGHTHFGWDAEIDGVRYVQAALGTPRERRHRMGSLEYGGIERRPVMVFDGEAGHFCPRRHASWSSYYEVNPRNPANVEPAPWVRARFARRVRKSRPPSESS